MRIPTNLLRHVRGPWRRLTRPTRIRLWGVALDIPPDTPESLRRVMYIERYERGEAFCIRKRLEPNDVVLEIGGGIGFISALCAKSIGSERVFTFEANPALIPHIANTHALNGVAPIVRNAMVAATSGDHESDTFYVEESFFSSSSTRLSETADAVQVPRLDVNDEIRGIKPTFIIMDIEGGEIELVPVIDWSGITKTMIEFHPDLVGEENVADAVRFLTDLGFEEDPLISTRSKKYFARPGN